MSELALHDQHKISSFAEMQNIPVLLKDLLQSQSLWASEVKLLLKEILKSKRSAEHTLLSHLMIS